MWWKWKWKITDTNIKEWSRVVYILFIYHYLSPCKCIPSVMVKVVGLRIRSLSGIFHNVQKWQWSKCSICTKIWCNCIQWYSFKRFLQFPLTCWRFPSQLELVVNGTHRVVHCFILPLLLPLTIKLAFAKAENKLQNLLFIFAWFRLVAIWLRGYVILNMWFRHPFATHVILSMWFCQTCGVVTHPAIYIWLWSPAGLICIRVALCSTSEPAMR